MINEGISKSHNCSINSLLYRFLQFSLTLNPPDILLKTLLSKVANHSTIQLFNAQDFAPYVATGFLPFYSPVLEQSWKAVAIKHIPVS